MIYAVLFASVFVGFVASNWVAGRAVQNLQREHNRREDLILNQMMHLVGRTWQPPPVAEPPDEPDGAVELRFETAPAQFGNVWGDE